MGRHVLQRPFDIGRIVASDPELAAFHDQFCEAIKVSGDEPALRMTPLRPRIRKQQVDAFEALWLQRRKQRARILWMNAHILELALGDVAQARGDAALEHLAADEANLRMACRL